jgi:hypothetical protein
LLACFEGDQNPDHQAALEVAVARILPGESHVELPAWSPASLLRIAVPQEEGLLVAGTVVLPAGEASGHLEGGDLFRLRIGQAPAESSYLGRLELVRVLIGPTG